MRTIAGYRTIQPETETGVAVLNAGTALDIVAGVQHKDVGVIGGREVHLGYSEADHSPRTLIRATRGSEMEGVR